METQNKSYQDLEYESCDFFYGNIEGLGISRCGSPDKAALTRLLQARGRAGRKALAQFEVWLIRDVGLAPSTAKRKRKIVWAASCDHHENPADKYHFGHEGEHCKGVKSYSFRQELRRALYDYCCWILDDADEDSTAWDRAMQIVDSMGFDLEEIEARVAVIAATRARGGAERGGGGRGRGRRR